MASPSMKRRRPFSLVRQMRPLLTMEEVVFLICFSFLTRNMPVLAQEKPNPMFRSAQFNGSAMYRQDLCERYDAVDQGLISLEDALQGVEIRSTSGQNQYFELNKETGGIDENYPGLMATLMDEVCRRAGCTWRNSFAVYDEPSLGHTWTEMLLWTTETYDISINWWSTSSERLAAGITYVESWHDASVIMVGKKNDKFNIWSWTAPFDTFVWISIIVTILLSGVVYMFLEYYHEHSDKKILDGSLLETTFMVAVAFTTHFAFSPTTHAARLFTFSISLWALLVSAAYTANLTSFLVARNQRPVKVDLVSLCVMESTQAEISVSNAYPQLELIQKIDMKEVFLGVKNGDCDIAVTTVAEWEFFQLDEESNGDCDLGTIGDPIEVVPAAFATTHDTSRLCTSLVADVFNVHMLKMKEDGFIRNAWDSTLIRSSTWNCLWRKSKKSKTNSKKNQLTVQNMGGMFVLLYLFILVSLAVEAGVRFKKKYYKRKKKENDQHDDELKSDDDFDLRILEDSEQEPDLSGVQSDKEDNLVGVEHGEQAPSLASIYNNGSSLPTLRRNIERQRSFKRTNALLSHKFGTAGRSLGHSIVTGRKKEKRKMKRRKRRNKLHDDDGEEEIAFYSCSSEDSNNDSLSSNESEENIQSMEYDEKKQKTKASLKTLIEFLDSLSDDLKKKTTIKKK